MSDELVFPLIHYAIFFAQNVNATATSRTLTSKNVPIPLIRYFKPNSIPALRAIFHSSGQTGGRRHTVKRLVPRDESSPLIFLAGNHVWQWTRVRKVKDGQTTDDLYGFPTTDPNAVVKPK
ncbi:hypothetical protein GGE66_000293 [Rhizobium leguminosarum]|uniref:Uncharacterized protein n=1 Tax=Rhizobium leguminosarum TaxID=384 RepID=A0A7W9ZPZ1_RHILE|nr:hypothetical protein [Rhizobium leguminosarum]MBB6219349.1 hypothetical protein [Rhizobium leguminosarum]